MKLHYLGEIVQEHLKTTFLKKFRLGIIGNAQKKFFRLYCQKNDYSAKNILSVI